MVRNVPDMGLVQCAKQVGEDDPPYMGRSIPIFKGISIAYVPFVTADARAGRNGLAVTHEPEAGDLAIYVWGGVGSDPDGDHIGLVDTPPVADGSFAAYEGSASVGNISNGGEVMHRTDRFTSEVLILSELGNNRRKFE